MSQEPNDRTTTVGELRQVVEQFVAERDWHRFHDLKNLSMSLSIEAAELMEHTQWLGSDQVQAAEGYDCQQVAEELADVLSYTLAIANRLEIDLSSAMIAKMAKNRLKYPLGSSKTAKGLPTE